MSDTQTTDTQTADAQAPDTTDPKSAVQAPALSVAAVNSLVEMSMHGEHGRAVALRLSDTDALAICMEAVFGQRTITRADAIGISPGADESSMVFADGFVQTFAPQPATDAPPAEDKSHVVMPSDGDNVTGPVPEIENAGQTPLGEAVDPAESAADKEAAQDAKKKAAADSKPPAEQGL